MGGGGMRVLDPGWNNFREGKFWRLMKNNKTNIAVFIFVNNTTSDELLNTMLKIYSPIVKNDY